MSLPFLTRTPVCRPLTDPPRDLRGDTEVPRVAPRPLTCDSSPISCVNLRVPGTKIRTETEKITHWGALGEVEGPGATNLDAPCP